MTVEELLNVIVFTAPYTLDDAREAYQHLRATCGPDAKIDIHSPRGTHVFVTITSPRGSLSRTYAVT